MLAAFEHWFGPYPFYEDSYSLLMVLVWSIKVLLVILVAIRHERF
jgi:hypothetical protein